MSSYFPEAPEPAEAPTVGPDPITDEIQQVFSTPQGQALLVWLRDLCHFVKPTFRPGDPHLSAFLEGKRNVYLAIVAHLEYDDVEIIKRAANRRSETR